MKKRLFNVAMSIVMLASVAPVTSCFGGGGTSDVSGGGGRGPDIETIDTTKTQIYVHNYNGGYGDAWLKDAKKRFEAAFANWEGDAGKKGVQVYNDNSKNNNTGNAIINNCQTSRDQIWFTQDVPYFDLVAQGVAYDITDVITQPLTAVGEDKTILSKMSEGHKDYLKYSVDGADKYYAIPHYESYPVITYDKDVFAKYKLYYADDVEDSDDGFIPVVTAKKSKGMDGQYNTIDDGLPTTWAEFDKLCERMVMMGVSPFLWSGLSAETYYPYVTTAARVAWDGYDTEYARYTQSGEVSGLVDVDANGNITPYNGTGTATITTENGYLLAKTEGQYYGLSIAEKIIKNKWYSSLSMQTTKSHIDAQVDFVMSNLENKPIGMFIDGSWWECEAVEGFKLAVETFGEEIGGKMSRNFGVMSLPTKDPNGTQTYVEFTKSQAFVNAHAMRNCTEKEISIVKDFLRFCYTDESLVAYTQITGTPRGVNYTMSKEQVASLSTYGQDLWTLKTTGRIVYPYVNNTAYKTAGGSLAPAHGIYFSAQTKDGFFPTTITAFSRSTKKATAVEYFNGVYDYAKDNWLF